MWPMLMKERCMDMKLTQNNKQNREPSVTLHEDAGTAGLLTFGSLSKKLSSYYASQGSCLNDICHYRYHHYMLQLMSEELMHYSHSNLPSEKLNVDTNYGNIPNDAESPKTL